MRLLRVDKTVVNLALQDLSEREVWSFLESQNLLDLRIGEIVPQPEQILADFTNAAGFLLRFIACLLILR